MAESLITKEEAGGYYYGLCSHPRLVARSDIEDKPWSARYDGWTVQKTIDPIRNHAIVPLWNKANSDLQTGIIATLGDLNWTAINILRLGYARRLNTLNEPDDMFPKLLISVQPESTSWQSGYTATLQCRQVLREHGINDVEVEMMEAWVSKCNSPRLTSQPITEYIQEAAQLSEFLGASIASEASPTCEGTKGFYVRLKDTNKLLAVACRHTLLDTFSDVDYRHSVNAPNMVIQPGQITYKATVEFLASFIKMLEERFDTLTPAKMEELRILRGLKANYDQINDLESRIIGHVLFSPEYSLSTSTPNVTWIRDWALVELHPDRHETVFSEIKNRVVAGPRANGQLFQALFHELSADHQIHVEGLFVDYPTNTYELTRPVQEREIRQPFEAARNLKNEPPMVVAKFGRTTGLTFGVANEAKSVLRKKLAGETVMSDELCIIGQKKKKGLCREAFSSKGDSGACILDMYGQVAGMLTSGMEAQNEDAFEITYATPIEWLLKDIRGYGLEVTLAEGYMDIHPGVST
ncbi:uncharacterized protein FFB20_00589 [Fusarium fujikuroi]|uniref:Uncharacterized protein n=1 Tax=Gibberella fujikuroi (strain CBS 195.34 / IMI 58289 / NRRL A-6831) TaxID=1279085 RepID=S0DQG0_GIBF5|nr:uncharacterized protein FFUJ_04101 [Fusarium fujikuroi IMI 58289]KLP02560.1 uncharacterized protein Y057_9523 [Fusarium fujikuroi]CCT64656.1 uncharacterized protein FFUJ_04101 [Fusarium fujikuroi IMI 58289]SCN64372.1 uncharacterized protein FFB20_00589 [Fusarium fujikuroi]SCN72917.1 uncharacterized protein FFE2_02697 [Fusarium fujikuroi]SCN88972.1 uncharacterized protein FFM5_04575 [Fusarium fujikuroi]